jgi:biotin-(acetyl-CoA carboxylase) ligase
VRFGVLHRHYRVTDSTNTRARELAAAGAPAGTVVTAEEQTAGRGRQGRAWTAPGGKALLYSAILRPLGDRPLLPLAVALAVCEAAEELAPGVACRIKWPNDVWAGERKLAGVLIETRTPSRDSSQATGERPATRDEHAGRGAGGIHEHAGRGAGGIHEDAGRGAGGTHEHAGRGAGGSHEDREGWAVVGVGLNLTVEPHELPPALRHPATSLAMVAAHAGRAAAEGWHAATDTGSSKASRAADTGSSEASRAADTGSDAASSSPAAHSPHPARLARPGGGNLSPEPARRALDARLGEWIAAAPERVLAAYRERDALRDREIAWSDGPDLDAVSGSGVAAGIDDRGGLVVRLGGGRRAVLFAGEVHLCL